MTRSAGLTGLDRTLLAAAVVPADRMDEAGSAWVDAASALSSEDGIEQFSGERQDLIGLLHRTARAAGAAGDLAARLAGGHRRLWLANQLQLGGLRALFTQFARDDVPILATGDLAILGRLGDVGARPLRRLRILVPASDFDRAQAALRREKWAVQSRAVGGYVADPRVHPYAGPGGVRLELTPCQTPDWEALRGEAHPVELAGAPALLIAGRSALIAELISDSAGWLPRPELLRLADTALLFAGATAAECRAAIAQLAGESQISAMRARLASVSQAIPGSVPEPARRAISAARPNRADRLAHRLDGVAPSLARHVRQTADAGPAKVVRTLPASVQTSWDLPSAWRIAPAAVTRVSRRLRQNRSR